MGEIKAADIKAMTVEQRLDLIERVWDTLVDTPSEIPVPDWHLDVLEKRLQDVDRTPEDGASWDDVEKRLLRRP